MHSSEKMAVNTAILYIKLILTIVVNLYSTRLILSSLGVSDFGIVNLISGIVVMLSFFQNSMTVSTQRYLSVSLGKNDVRGQKMIFNTSFVLHVILAFIIFAILESASPLIFNSSINIPVERLSSAYILYQMMILSTIIVIISVPYDAVLNAHENMLWFSLANILEAIIKLTGAFILLSYSHDKLIFYGLLIVFIRIASMFFKASYCILKYDDAKIDKQSYSFKKMKELFSFSFWNLFGAFAWTARGQGISVVLNIFGGVVVNAAYGISHQVSGQLSNFTSTITKAMAPQIMKSKGSKDFRRMRTLSLKQSKYSFYLLLMMASPLYVDIEFILSLWLKEVPAHTVMFCKLAILVALLQQLSSGLMTLIQANGNIRSYQICISAITILCIPLSAIVLYYGYPLYTVFFVLLGVEVLALIARIVFSKHLVSLAYKEFTKEILVPSACLFVMVFLITYGCKITTIDEHSSFLVFFVHTILVEIGIVIGVALVLQKEEIQFLSSFIKKIYSHLKVLNKI